MVSALCASVVSVGLSACVCFSGLWWWSLCFVCFSDYCWSVSVCMLQCFSMISVCLLLCFSMVTVGPAGGVCFSVFQWSVLVSVLYFQCFSVITPGLAAFACFNVFHWSMLVCLLLCVNGQCWSVCSICQ